MDHEGYPLARFGLMAGESLPSGGGTAAEHVDLPPAPANVHMTVGDGQITLAWDPIPEALFYNIYFKTSRGVTREAKEFDRFRYDAVGAERFQKTKIGVTKENGSLIDTAVPPYQHSDLANGTCYHYVVTAVTRKGESAESAEVVGIPAPYLCVMEFGTEGYDDGEFKSPTGIALDPEGHIYVADTDTHTVQKFDKEGRFLARLGDEAGDAEGQFYYPRGLACDSEGNLIVIDAINNRVQKFDSRGNFLAKWGREGKGPGEFSAPWGIAVDALGNVYVVDTNNHRIQKFTSNGVFICQWGNRGWTKGQLNFPYGIAVDREGFVYVVDSGNCRVMKYASVETHKAEEPQVSGQLPAPAELSAKAGDTEVSLAWMDVPGAASYNLYYHTDPGVTRETGTCIEGVSSPYTHVGLSNGTSYRFVLTAITAEGTESEPSPEVEATPSMIDRAAPQNAYMIINHGAFMTNLPDVVLTISANDVDSGVAGYYISETPSTPTATTPGWVDVEPIGKFGSTVPYTLSPGDGQKTIYVWFKDVGGNISVPGNNAILLNTSGYMCVNTWGKAGSGAHLLQGGEFGTPSFGLACDQNSDLYVVDTGNCRIQKFNNAGNFIQLWGMFGTAPSNFQNPTGIAVDEKNVVYVCDTGNHRIQRFDARNGAYLSKWGRQGGGDGQFNAPWGVAVDNKRGYVYVVDSANFRVQKFDRTGEFIMAWGSFGNADGQFYFCRGIAVDESDGAVYVVDMGNHRIQKFDTSTNFLPQLLVRWGTKGQEPGQFWNPWGIAVDRDGFVYVTDTGNHRVQKFDRDGNFETQWGGFGGARGQFNFPYGIAVDRRGSTFVLDSSNFRVQQFMTADEGELQLREQPEVAESESSALEEKKTIQQESPGTHLWSTPKQ